MSNFSFPLCLAALIVIVILGAQASRCADKQVLQQVHAAEAEYERYLRQHEDDATVPWAAWEKLMNAQKKLMTLREGQQDYPPTSVYKSSKLLRGWDMSGMIADDTIHTTEGLNYVTIKCHPGERLPIKMAWAVDSLSRCDFYLGEPGQMHADGYRSVRKLSFDGQAVLLPDSAVIKVSPKLSGPALLLFAIVKPKAESDYRKFVFVIRFAQSQN